MRICHVCLSNYFAEGFLYQENQLVQKHSQLGHEVLVLASTETYDGKGQRVYVSPGDKIIYDNVRLIRLPYRKLGLSLVERKVRSYPNVLQYLSVFEPDVIMFHGLAGWELLNVVKYVRNNPSCKLVVDSHTDKNNSARTFGSSLLHKLYYRPIVRSVMDSIGKILCISSEVEDFARDVYGLPSEKLEFFPLGGDVLEDEEYERRRASTRRDLGIGEQDIVIVQAGRFDERKRLVESLRAFSRTRRLDIKFFVSGSFAKDIADEVEGLVANDKRIIYTGWSTTESLTELLCAADVYLQPGTQSVTMQHSLCCRCPVVLADVPAHERYVKANGWLINSEEDIYQVLEELDREALASMSRHSYEFARRYLDYTTLAKRVLQ